MISFKNRIGLFLSLIACTAVALTSGCASGGFKLTRQFAGWLNSQNIIVRIILYILIGAVFFVTILIDVVVNNTVDFWNGTVSAGDYEFQKDGHIFLVRHEFQDGTKRKRTTIKIENSDKKLLQTLLLSETPKGEIELYVDQKLRARVRGISEIPMIARFDLNGRWQDEKMVPMGDAKPVLATK